MNTELSAEGNVGNNKVHTVCVLLVNFVNVLVVLKAETAFSVLFRVNLVAGIIGLNGI